MASILRRIRDELPTTEIYLQSVMPRLRRWAPQVRELNRALEHVASQHNAAWIDLWPVLDDGTGRLTRGYTFDGLHPNRRGTGRWADHIRPLVEA